MDALGLDDGKIELGLRKMNLDALSGSQTGDGARSHCSGDNRGRLWCGKRQHGFGPRFVAIVAARTVNFEPPSDFSAPLGLFGRIWLARRRWLGEGRLAKWAHLDVRIANRATLRADLNHRFVLRCGP